MAFVINYFYSILLNYLFQSTLDFCIHLQEFIELVRNNHRAEAIGHARKYLNGSIPEQHSTEFQSAMGLLVLSPQSKKELNNEYQVNNERFLNLIIKFCFQDIT